MGNSETKNANYGYRIIKVAPGSPAQKAGLIEFLDYIIDISSSTDQTPFSGNYGDFFKIVQNSEDKEATLQVYNILHRSVRTVTIVPSKKWENADSLLGALVRYEEYATAHERVLRIAAVHPQSPASQAGLQQEHDYILGSPQYLYTDLNELANFIEMTQEKETIKSLELYIYSSQTNSVRSTLIIPNKNWGGAGHLGCEFALGILNYLPHLEDRMFISNLGEVWNNSSHEHAERLDDDDTGENTRLKPALGTVNNEESRGEQGLQKASEINQDKNASEELKLEEEKKLVSKTRPPTDSEIDHNRPHPPVDYDKDNKPPLPNHHELSSQKMRLLHLEHQHKIGVKSVSKPFIKSGKSISNPFHDPKQASAPANEHEQSALTSFSHSESTEGSTFDQSQVKASSRDQLHNEHDKQAQVKESGQVPSKEHSPTPNVNQDAVKNERVEELKQDSAKNDIVNNVEEKLAVSEKDSKVDLQINRSEENSEVNELHVEENKTAPEKQVCKTTFEYNFFSKKLNGDYKIKSTYLFNIEELGQTQ